MTKGFLLQNLVKDFVEHFITYKKFFFQNFLAGLIVSIISIPLPWISKILIDEVFSKKNYSILDTIILITFIISIFYLILISLRETFSNLLGMEISRKVRNNLIDKIKDFPIRYFDKTKTGEILTKINDADHAVEILVDIISALAIDLIQIIVLSLILFLINWQLAIISLIILPVQISLHYFIYKKIKDYSLYTAKEMSDLNSETLEFFSGIKTIQSLNLEMTFFNRLKIRIDSLFLSKVKSVLFQQLTKVSIGIFSTFGTMIYSFYGWHNIISGNLSLGSFIAFSSYVGLLYSPLKEFITIRQKTQLAVTQFERFKEFYLVKPVEINNTPPIMLDDLIIDIRFFEVDFSYDNNKFILKNVNLNIESGKLTWITGPNGAGKSSLVNLIGRYYEPNQGKIFFGNIDIRDISIYNLRNLVGIHFQNSFIFKGTIEENLFCFVPATKENIEKLFRFEFISDFLSSLPNGLKTFVGENGIGLSQGQKQLVGLTRVMLRETPILIFDEATSFIDSLTEEKIFNTIRSLKNKTIVFITHRKDLFRFGDKLISIENGNTIEH